MPFAQYDRAMLDTNVLSVVAELLVFDNQATRYAFTISRISSYIDQVMVMVMVKTILTYSLTRECLYLVRRGYFWSCDKDDIHTMRCDIAENPTYASLCVVEPVLLPIEV